MLIRDHALLGSKVESTEGVAVALAAADCTLLVWDLTYKAAPEFTVRNPVANTLSHRQSVRGKAFGEISFKFELKGEDSTADSVPSWSRILQAAGLKETVNVGVSVEWEPYDDLGDFSEIPTLTMGVYVDGVYRQLRGARCSSCTINGPVGGVITATVTFRGVVDQESAVALPSPTFPTALPEVLGHGVCVLDALNFTGTMFDIDLGLQSAERYDPQLEFGCRSVAVTNFEPTMTLDPERELPATKSFLNEMLSNAVVDFQAQVGTGVTGHQVTIDCNRVQWEGEDDNERDGLAISGLTGRILGPEAGGTAIKITKT